MQDNSWLCSFTLQGLYRGVELEDLKEHYNSKWICGYDEAFELLRALWSLSFIHC